MFRNLNTGMIGVQATLPEAIGHAKAHGFGGIDLSIGEVQTLAQKHGVGYVKDLFAAAGVRPGSWSFPVEFRRDEEAWRAGLKALPMQAQLACDLGCIRTATWIMPGDNERTFQQNFDFHVDRLRPAAQILADYGCVFGLEFVGPRTQRTPRKYAFIHTLDGMRALCAAIGTGNLGLLLDIFHLYTSGGAIADLAEITAQDVVVVHVNDAIAGRSADEQIDNQRALPCETGVLDMAGFLQGLQAMGYDGPVTAEPFSQRVRDLPAAEALAQTAAAMRKAWSLAGL